MSDTSGRPVNVTATAVVSAVPAAVTAVIVGVAAAGQTVKLHNAKTTGAANAGNRVATIALDTVMAYPLGGDGAYFDVGVVAVISGGSPDIVVVVA